MAKSELEMLSDRVSELESKNGKFGKSKSINITTSEKKPRKPSEYNIFVQEYIATEKKKGNGKKHSELFSEAAKAWSSAKK